MCALPPAPQDNLAAAEHATRAAELRIVYAAFKNVAQYFAQEGKSRKAIKFFLKCLDIAVTVWRPSAAAPVSSPPD